MAVVVAIESFGKNRTCDASSIRQAEAMENCWTGNKMVGLPRKSVAVFLKPPIPGLVKTRIGQSIGNEAACRIYWELLDRTFAELAKVRGSARILALFDGPTLTPFERWRSAADEWIPQSNGHLGARLDDCFQDVDDSTGPRLAIGADCPELKSQILEQAFEKLTAYDLVVGPAKDGGYYLIGCRRHCPGLFDGIRWSHAETMADQLARARGLRLEYSLLQVLADIDTHDDWLAYCNRIGMEWTT